MPPSVVYSTSTSALLMPDSGRAASEFSTWTISGAAVTGMGLGVGTGVAVAVGGGGAVALAVGGCLAAGLGVVAARLHAARGSAAVRATAGRGRVGWGRNLGGISAARGAPHPRCA